jgi:hypothetical protein
MRRVLIVTDPSLEPVRDGVVAFAQANGWDVDGSMHRNGRLPECTHAVAPGPMEQTPPRHPHAECVFSTAPGEPAEREQELPCAWS